MVPAFLAEGPCCERFVRSTMDSSSGTAARRVDIGGKTMRMSYVQAKAQERVAWREFIAATLASPDSRAAYERWQAAQAHAQELAARLKDAGLCPPDTPLTSSVSFGRRPARSRAPQE